MFKNVLPIRIVQKFNIINHNYGIPSKNISIIQHNVTVITEVKLLRCQNSEILRYIFLKSQKKKSLVHILLSFPFIFKLPTRCYASVFNCKVSIFTKCSNSWKQVITSLTDLILNCWPWQKQNLSAIFWSHPHASSGVHTKKKWTCHSPRINYFSIRFILTSHPNTSVWESCSFKHSIVLLSYCKSI